MSGVHLPSRPRLGTFLTLFDYLDYKYFVKLDTLDYNNFAEYWDEMPRLDTLNTRYMPRPPGDGHFSDAPIFSSLVFSAHNNSRTTYIVHFTIVWFLVGQEHLCECLMISLPFCFLFFRRMTAQQVFFFCAKRRENIWLRARIITLRAEALTPPHVTD